MVEKVYSVSGLTRKIRGVLEYEVGEVWVEGEISNHRAQSSGHHYFTLKDAGAQLACVLFRGQAARTNVTPENGSQVQVFGEVSVYETRGQYQLIVRSIQLRGEGMLQARFEALKKTLHAEGLFEESRKKQVPTFPRVVALVTSSSGAALQDMLNVLERRCPWLQILLCPVAVQGEGAWRQIVAAIQYCNELSRSRESGIDTLILARGGGSLEDLWNFNEEMVARAIVASEIPVISGIGHEIDFTIADFASDLRAPTPSAAAELVAPDGEELSARLRDLGAQLTFRTGMVLERLEEKLDTFATTAVFREPVRIVRELEQDLDAQEERVVMCMEAGLALREEMLSGVASRLVSQNPELAVQEKEEELERFASRLALAIEAQFTRWEELVDARASLLQSLGLPSIFERGFSITTDTKGRPINSVSAVMAGDSMVTRVADGSILSAVSETEATQRAEKRQKA
jgi:exodeoxyribonuclease VII large subunit